MSCNCGKPKCKCGISPAVLQINNPEECTLFHKVTVPASMGDSKTNPPKNGAYKNVLLYYEADQTSWMFSSDGIPTQLVNGMTNYEEAQNLPSINNHTLLGNMSGSDLDLQDKLIAGDNIQIAGTTISATDTTYDDFVGATSDAAGEAGLVPAPASGVTEKFLKSDGTWSDTTAFLPYPASVNKNGTTPEFIASIQALNAEVGTAYLGTVSLTDLPEGLVQEEVMAYVYDNNVIYLTLRSADTAPYIWNCNSYAYRGWEPIDTTTVTVLWANSTESGNTRHLYSDSAMYNAVSMDDVINAAHKGLLFVRIAHPLTPEQYNESVLVNVWVSPNDNDYQVIFTDGNYTYNYGADALTDTAFAYSSGQYQRKLTAGAGIDITGNTISVKDPAPEDFFDGPATNSDCGVNITLDNMIGGQPVSFELRGNTEQTTYTGKNLCNGISQNYWLNNASNSAGRSAGNSGLAISVSANTSYTVSAKSSQARYRVALVDTLPYLGGGSVTAYSGQAKDGTSDSITINSGSHGYLIVNATSLTDIQIEVGSSSATPFEPYVGGVPAPNPNYPQAVQTVTGENVVKISDGQGNEQSYTISLGSIELCKIGDNRDYIWNDSGTWKVHKAIKSVVLNGTEHWTDTSSGVPYTDSITDYARSDNAPFASHFSSESNKGTAGNVSVNKIAFNDTTNYNRLWVKYTSDFPTSSALTSWLVSNNVVVYYALATPTDTAISDQALIEQLEVIKLASGTNTITVTSANLAAELCIEGYADNWPGNIANIDAEIEERVIAFDTVADMKSASLSAGEYARTGGYYSVNDGGDGLYKVESTGTADGGSVIALANGLYAHLIVEDNTVNVRQYGAHGDGVFDDTAFIQAALDSGCNVYIPGGVYITSSGLTMPFDIRVSGESRANTVIKSTVDDGFILTYGTSYNYGNYKGIVENITFTSTNSISEKPNGIYLYSGITISKCEFRTIGKAIDRVSNYIDMVKIEDTAFLYCVPNGDYIVKLSGNQDSLTLDHIKFESYTGDTTQYNGIYIDTCHGGEILDSICNCNITLFSVNAFSINNMHIEGLDRAIYLTDCNVSINNLFKFKNTSANDIVLATTDYQKSNTVELNNVLFTRNSTNLDQAGSDEINAIPVNTILKLDNVFRHVNLADAGERTNVIYGISINGNTEFNTLSGVMSVNSNVTTLDNKCLATVNNPGVTQNFGTIGKSSRYKWRSSDTSENYRAVIIADETRKVICGYSSNQTISSLTENGDGVVFAVNNDNYNKDVYLYRGQAVDTYTERVKLSICGRTRVFDTGLTCMMNTWETVTQTNGRANYNYVTKYTKDNDNVIVYASATPSYGTWKKFDKVINTNTASGQDISWIYDGANWVSQGTYA